MISKKENISVVEGGGDMEREVVGKTAANSWTNNMKYSLKAFAIFSESEMRLPCREISKFGLLFFSISPVMTLRVCHRDFGFEADWVICCWKYVVFALRSSEVHWFLIFMWSFLLSGVRCNLNCLSDEAFCLRSLSIWEFNHGNLTCLGRTLPIEVYLFCIMLSLVWNWARITSGFPSDSWSLQSISLNSALNCGNFDHDIFGSERWTWVVGGLIFFLIA